MMERGLECINFGHVAGIGQGQMLTVVCVVIYCYIGDI